MTISASKSFETSGIRLISRGYFWPIGLVMIDRFEASVFVPDTLSLNAYDHVAIKVGELPSFAAVVKTIENDMLGLQFLDAVHPRILSMIDQKATGPSRKRSGLDGLRDLLVA